MLPQITILQGDWIEMLKTLPDESVQCCVSSPPYWGLRKYGGWQMQSLWGNQSAFFNFPPKDRRKLKHRVALLKMRAEERGIVWSRDRTAHICALGLEPTPELYVEHMVAGFREIQRILRSDGTLWLNLGDSFANDGKWGGATGGKHASALHGEPVGRSRRFTGLKSKDLVGIPWRIAFALQADGWYLRSDIIWHKPNPMPESVTDRPTKAHEYIFLLSKSPNYFFDAEAVKEPVTGGAHARANGANSRMAVERAAGRENSKPNPSRSHIPGVCPKSAPSGSGIKANESFHTAIVDLVSNRNKRSVWTVATYSYPDSHFAAFPPDLIKPCILAGSSAKGCCPNCKAPWERIIENGEPDLDHQRACGGDINGQYDGKATKDYGSAKCQDPSAVKARILRGMVEKKTVDWKPTCSCLAHDPIPCTVLDPFLGSGTTGEVSLELGRHCIGIELNTEYVTLAKHRCDVTPGLPLA